MAIAPKHGDQAFSHRDFDQRLMASAAPRRLSRRREPMAHLRIWYGMVDLGVPEAEEDQKISQQQRLISSAFDQIQKL